MWNWKALWTFLLGLWRVMSRLHIWGSFRHGQQPTHSTSTTCYQWYYPGEEMPSRASSCSPVSESIPNQEVMPGKGTVKLNESAHWQRTCCLQQMVVPLVTMSGMMSMAWLVLSDISVFLVSERAGAQLCQPRLRSASVLALIVFLLLRSLEMRAKTAALSCCMGGNIGRFSTWQPVQQSP